MKVRITKAKFPTYWYADKIGQIFEVNEKPQQISSKEMDYIVKVGEYNCNGLLVSDCEIIADPVKIPFTFELWDKDRTQKVWTRDGREVKQLTLFDALDYAFAGVIDGELEAFTKEGYAIIGGKDSRKDIFLAHTEKEYFVNVYRGDNGVLRVSDTYETFEAAERIGKNFPDYIKTIPFTA